MVDHLLKRVSTFLAGDSNSTSQSGRAFQFLALMDNRVREHHLNEHVVGLLHVLFHQSFPR